MLACGAYAGGAIDLIKMRLKQVDDLQGKMPAHPKNKWNSSAVGRNQIVRTTRRNIREARSIPSSAKFDRDIEDRMGRAATTIRTCRLCRNGDRGC